jgi:hypothetical protein
MDFTGVACNPSPCLQPTGCCSFTGGVACASATICSRDLGILFACDGPEDCGAGEVCCGSDSSGTICLAAFDCPNPTLHACHSSGDCVGNQGGVTNCCAGAGLYSYCDTICH